MLRKRFWLSLSLVGGATILLLASPSINVKDDPLVRMPGTQPAPEGNVSLEAPDRCLNCHAGYNTSVEPGFNWQGSMMAQSARDFLFYACMTVSGQDSVWAIGRPNATDLCLRCHFPKGWSEGRSDPPNGAAMTAADFDGVQCDFCHRSYDPFFETTYSGMREGADWSGYWDETNASGTPSQEAANETYLEDANQALEILRFNGEPLFGANLLPPGYAENASGQYFLSTGAAKRAPFADAAARHQMLYSRYHKSKYFCASCHDVSNPILANLLLGGVGAAESRESFPPGRTLWTEDNPAYSYYHVERTFSEFMLSDYGRPGGAPGIGPFAPSVFETSYANNWVARCQDCHMRDVEGAACNKKGVPHRTGDPATTESVEHPYSAQPLHDLTGGNVWVSWVLASAVPGSPNYDPFNDQQLNQGPAALTLDLSQGLGVDPNALLAGADRARQQLQLAASIQNISYDPVTGGLGFRVQNQSGHKLISGFPEGRRMFINVRAYSGGSLVYEINPYDHDAGTLKGLHYPYQPDPNGVLPAPGGLQPDEVYIDELVYEMHPSSRDLTGEAESFHFALATGRYKDNRIPPKGFRVAEADDRLSVPVWEGVENQNYYSPAEYAGGYDDVSLALPAGADTVEVSLYYQTTSREYIEFLRDEINGNPDNCTLPSSPGTEGCDLSNYIVQNDPYFAQLKAWGDTIWQLWSHNMNADGAAPVLMARATVGDPGGCRPPTPTVLSAMPGNKQVTLVWTDEHSADPDILSYNVYYDQAGKAQFIADAALDTTYTDLDLINGQEYCYKVTAGYSECESDFSNILCATPRAAVTAGADDLITGLYTGKGRNQTFAQAGLFAQGDDVVFRAHVVDAAGAPVEGAMVQITVTGPETVTLTTAHSDAQGFAEATWNTSKPNKKGIGGTARGTYTGTVTGLTSNTHEWDGRQTTVSLTIE